VNSTWATNSGLSHTQFFISFLHPCQQTPVAIKFNLVEAFLALGMFLNRQRIHRFDEADFVWFTLLIGGVANLIQLMRGRGNELWNVVRLALATFLLKPTPRRADNCILGTVHDRRLPFGATIPK
jgi:hypothetical protein